MIVAEKYKHRPHPLEVVEVTLDNYLEVAAYVGSSESVLHRNATTDGAIVHFHFAIPTKRNNQMSVVTVELPGKITIDHERIVTSLSFMQENLKDNYKKA